MHIHIIFIHNIIKEGELIDRRGPGTYIGGSGGDDAYRGHV